MRALAIGKFDALHPGHAALLNVAAEHGDPCLLSFSGMAEILGWELRKPLLSIEGREWVLDQWSRELGCDITTIEIPFGDIHNLQPSAFIEYLQLEYPFSAIITGYNFHFGFNRSGNVQTLRELAATHDFKAVRVDAVCYDGAAVSSSRIRSAVEAGDCDLAAALLQRPYASTGKVVKGDGQGRSLGFPTANIAHIRNVLPAKGVYAARAFLENDLIKKAVVRIGHLPSIGGERPLSIVVHLLDYTGDCYKQTMRLEWVARMRDEKKFDSLDTLKNQISNDVAAAAALIAD